MNNDLETQGGIIDGGDSGALTTLALQRQRHPVALAGTGAVISKFNRDTMVLTVATSWYRNFRRFGISGPGPSPKNAGCYR
jgi:hypothetical protein